MKPILLPKLFILSLLFISVSLFALTPKETKQARKTWLKGYEYFEGGEKAFENEQLRESHTYFKESLQIFNDLKIKYPGWSSSMIDYRIKLCNVKLALIKKQLESKNIKITDKDVDKANLLLKNKLNTIEDELKKTKKKLSIALTSLEAARREAARNLNSSSEMEKLLKEKAELEKRYSLLLERNKKLQMETGTVSVETAEESKKALDAALLEIETLKDTNKVAFEKLQKEKNRFAKIATENTQLRYDNKVLLENIKKANEEMKALNGKISENNEIFARWEKEKVEFGQTLNETHKKITERDAKIKELQDKLDEIRDNPNEDTIAKQVENENELLLKDIEVVNLQLAKELKEKKKVIEEKEVLQERVLRIEKALATSLQNKNKSTNDLDVLQKKALISETIIKKQDKTIADQKAENEKLNKELEELADKYKNIDKKEKEFIALANESIKVENENRMLKTDLAKLKIEKESISAEIKKSEVKILQMQKEMQQIISDNSNAKKDEFILREKLKEEISYLKKKISLLNSELETNNKKLTMMTEELVSVNAMLTEKENLIVETKKVDVKEPEIFSKTPEYINLKKENDLLLVKLQEKEAELTALKSNKSETTETTETTKVTPKTVNEKQIKKMLESASSAEENEKKEAASWYYEKVLELDPSNNIALTRLGYIKASKGSYEEAIELLNKGLILNPGDIEKMQTLTFCYIKEKQFYNALSVAAKTNSIDRKNPKNLRFLGIIYSNMGLKTAAEKQFRESFKIDPTSAETAFNSAVLLTSFKERLDEAKLWYEKAVDLGAERDPGIEKILNTAN